MTGRTHDLAAFTTLNYVFVSQSLEPISLSTALFAFGANMIGGLAPDIDQPTATFWRKVRGGTLISRLISPMLGGHRFISHSLLGIILFGFVTDRFLIMASSTIRVEMSVVWWSFMIGFVSHLIIDTLTREGVPWIFPIPIRFGFPPLKFLRLKTGGLVEKSFVFPGLLILNAYFFYTHYDKYISFFKNYLR